MATNTKKEELISKVQKHLRAQKKEPLTRIVQSLSSGTDISRHTKEELTNLAIQEMSKLKKNKIVEWLNAQSSASPSTDTSSDSQKVSSKMKKEQILEVATSRFDELSKKMKKDNLVDLVKSINNNSSVDSHTKDELKEYGKAQLRELTKEKLLAWMSDHTPVAQGKAVATQSTQSTADQTKPEKAVQTGVKPTKVSSKKEELVRQATERFDKLSKGLRKSALLVLAESISPSADFDDCTMEEIRAGVPTLFGGLKKEQLVAWLNEHEISSSKSVGSPKKACPSEATPPKTPPPKKGSSSPDAVPKAPSPKKASSSDASPKTKVSSAEEKGIYTSSSLKKKTVEEIQALLGGKVEVVSGDFLKDKIKSLHTEGKISNLPEKLPRVKKDLLDIILKSPKVKKNDYIRLVVDIEQTEVDKIGRSSVLQELYASLGGKSVLSDKDALRTAIKQVL